jgi:hypothetical protein
MGRAVASKRSLAAVIVCKRGSKPARGIGGGGLGADGGKGMADGVSSQVSDICGSKYLFFSSKSENLLFDDFSFMWPTNVSAFF